MVNSSGPFTAIRQSLRTVGAFFKCLQPQPAPSLIAHLSSPYRHEIIVVKQYMNQVFAGAQVWSIVGSNSYLVVGRKLAKLLLLLQQLLMAH